MTIRTRSLLLMCGVVGAWMSGVGAAETVSFQNGVNGYTGTLDLQINDNNFTRNGASVSFYPFDGRQANGTENDRHGLIRFDDILGTEPGRIPPGVTILSAKLELTTATQAESSSANSGGPMVVARLLKPFDTSTVFGSFGIEGPDLLGGDFARPVCGYGNMDFGLTYGADVTSIVQAWADGEPNNGFIILATDTDAWTVHTTGHADVGTRPRLVVEYTRVGSRSITLQQGLNGYSGTNMMILDAVGDATTFGETVNTTYLDGNPVIEGAVRFLDVVGSGADQVSSTAEVMKAYLVVATGPKSDSFNTRSPGPYSLHRMLVDCDWDGTDWSKPSLWSDFISADGPTEADGEIGPAIASVSGMGWDAEAWFDVTSAVKAWQNGEPNLGFNIKSGTGDGWKVYCTGGQIADARPKLVIKVASRGADLDLDGDVDLDDFVLLSDCGSGPSIPHANDCGKADLDSDGDVDQNDFAVYQRCYSGPKPASLDCL